MSIRTRCTDVDEVVSLFTPFVEDTSLFVATLTRTPQGMESSFRVLLANGAIVLRGRCVVRKVWSTTDSPFRLPGLMLVVRKLTPDSEAIFDRIRGAASKAARAPAPPPPPPSRPAAGTIVPSRKPASGSGCVETVDSLETDITRPFRVRFLPATSQRKNPVAAVSEGALAELVDRSLAPWPTRPNQRRRP